MVNRIKVRVSRVTVYYPDWRASVRPLVRCRSIVVTEGEDGGGPPSSPRPGQGARVLPMMRRKVAA